jgi:hypothetical protein
VAFACPGCGAEVARSPEAWLLRCRACGALLRSRALEPSGDALAYEVEVAGRPETRRRVELPWDAAQGRRLRAWLLWSSAITLGMVALLYGLARALR